MVADTDSGSQARWAAFVEALIADRDLLTKRIRVNLREQLPAYRLVSDRELDWGFRIDLDSTLIAARAGPESVTDEHLAGLTPVGEARARQGIAIQDVLIAWRIGVQIVLDRATEIGPQLDISPEEMLRFVRALIAASDRAMAIIVSAHRGAELELAKREHERRATVVREALLGTISPVVVRAHAEACGIDLAYEYVAIRAEAGTEERTQRERQLGFQSPVTPREGLGATIDDDLAGFLRRPPVGELAFAVGVGPPDPSSGCPSRSNWPLARSRRCGPSGSSASATSMPSAHCPRSSRIAPWAMRWSAATSNRSRGPRPRSPPAYARCSNATCTSNERRSSCSCTRTRSATGSDASRR